MQLSMAKPDLPDIWLPEIVDCIAYFLGSNEFSCSLRLVNKATAEHFPKQVTVHLSQPVPHHAFRHKWANHNIMKTLTYSKRSKLLALIAASGCLQNLELALEYAGIDLAPLHENDPLAAASSAGHIHICIWLHQHGCQLRSHQLQAAAKAGQQPACAWLLDHGCRWDENAVYSAAQGGYPELIPWLLTRRPEAAPSPNAWQVLRAASAACNLPTFQRLYRTWQPLLNWLESQHPATEDQQEQRQGQHRQRQQIISAAAGSLLSDWQAKVEWLEQLGFPRTAGLCTAAAGCPDAVARLQWLLARGYPVHAGSVWEAAKRGDVAALGFLLDYGIGRDTGVAARFTATEGHLEAFQFLCARGWLTYPSITIYSPVGRGHTAVVKWLVEAEGLVPGRFEQHMVDELVESAAAAGSVELLDWLHEQGCRAEGCGVGREGVRSGCGEVLEWMVAHGYSFEDAGASYEYAVRSGDLATLACLLRLGCPWGPDAKTFTQQDCPPRVRAWLDEVGLPYMMI